MFKPVERNGKILGWAMNGDRAFFFFGTRHGTREELTAAFPSFQFCFLKQVHGKAVVAADYNTTLEADAQFTIQPGLALISQSADCTPILLASDDLVCSIHAGWRGMAQNIIGAVHQKLPNFHPKLAAIGPHILSHSFEVGMDVKVQLDKASARGSDHSKPHSQSDKVFFDLAALAREQLNDSFGSGLKVSEYLRDTLTDLDFHSYRRGKTTPDRQYSFVVLNP